MEFYNPVDRKQYKKWDNSDYLVKPTDPEKKYQKGSSNRSIHWGQRKLGLALVQFLTFYWNPKEIPDPIVVYAGAAHGVNIGGVSKLFPDVTFVLYDPGNFLIEETEKIKIYKELFRIETAQQWKKYIEDRQKEGKSNNVFLVSDIRREITHSEEEVTVETEVKIWEDMKMQAEWYRIIKPHKAQLKFRLPYVDKKTKNIFKNYVPYLSGTLYRGIWAPVFSTECRLVPEGYEDKYWDIKKHESQMFYFNTEVRGGRQLYINPYYETYYTNTEYKDLDESIKNAIFTPINPPEILNDYDSIAETNLWILYLSRTGIENATLENVKMLEKFMTQTISMGDKSNDLRFHRIVSGVIEIVKLYRQASKQLKYEKNLEKIKELKELQNKYEVYKYEKYNFNQIKKDDKDHILFKKIAREIIKNIDSENPKLKEASINFLDKIPYHNYY